MTYRRLANLTLTLALAGGLSNVLAQETGGAAPAGEDDAPILLQPGTEGEGSGDVQTGGTQTGGMQTGGAEAGDAQAEEAPPAIKPADAATLPEGVEREVLVEGMQEPMTLDITDDGRVFYVERLGNVKLWSEDEGLQDVHTFDVYTEEEHGLMGIALDPEFESNNYIYIYYTAAEGEGNNLLSRFTYSEEGGEPNLDVESEEVLLEVPSDRDTCCHQAGDIEFGPDGKLYLSTGDNINPFESDGYAPIDEREGRAYFNALRTSPNLGDLRGKILRLNKDGSVPEDNPFVDTPDARPEIYALGFRNPFRFIVDPETGWLLVGNVGPDAEEPDPQRGPAGQDEWHVITEPGQDAGWPTCIGDNMPYEDWNFATETSEGTFDCSDKTPAVIWYPYGPSEEFPELDEGGLDEGSEGRRGRNAQGGPILRNVEGAEYTWDDDYTDKWLIYEWMRNFIKLATLSEDGTEVTAIEPFISDLVRPMDLKQGPDGALYLLEYGSGWFAPNEDARLSRITSTQD